MSLAVVDIGLAGAAGAGGGHGVSSSPLLLVGFRMDFIELSRFGLLWSCTCSVAGSASAAEENERFLPGDKNDAGEREGCLSGTAGEVMAVDVASEVIGARRFSWLRLGGIKFSWWDDEW